MVCHSLAPGANPEEVVLAQETRAELSRLIAARLERFDEKHRLSFMLRHGIEYDAERRPILAEDGLSMRGGEPMSFKEVGAQVGIHEQTASRYCEVVTTALFREMLRSPTRSGLSHDELFGGALAAFRR